MNSASSIQQAEGMRLSILAPRLPPAVCGVADHTMQLAGAMTSLGLEVGLIHCEPRLPGPPLSVSRVDWWHPDSGSLLRCVENQKPDWLWIQLSGYGYSRWGAPWRLGRAVADVRRRMPRLRVAVYVHETHCAPSTLGAKGVVLSPWQRFTVGRLARLGDIVFSSNPAQLEEVHFDYGVAAANARLLAVGTNMPAVEVSPEQRARYRAEFGWSEKETVAVVFGSWAMQVRTLDRHDACLREAVAEGKIDRVACIGGSSAARPAVLSDRQRTGPLKDRLTVFGWQEPDEVGRIIACCDLGIVEPTRRMVCKSTGFTALAINGLPVLVAGEGDPGFGFDAEPGCMFPERFLRQEHSKSQLAEMGHRMRCRALETFNWDAVGRTALTLLRTVDSRKERCAERRESRPIGTTGTRRTRLTIVTPELPPMVGGVADHSALLAESFTDEGIDVSFVCYQPPGRLPFKTDYPVTAWDGEVGSFLDCVGQHSPDWLWIQLSGYGYSRWGAPLQLGRAVARARRSLPGLNLAICIHETHCLVKSLGLKGPVLSPWQRFVVGRLARMGDAIFSSNPAQRQQIVRDYGVSEQRTTLLPIGSNIPAVELSTQQRAELRRGLGWEDHEVVAVTFGTWGMQLRALRRHGDCLRQALQQGIIHRIVCLGGNPQTTPSELREHPDLDWLVDKTIVLGWQPPEKIGRILQCCNIGLVEPDRRMMCKSGGFLAMAVNGLPVLVAGDGDAGYGLDSIFVCIPPAKFLEARYSAEQLADFGKKMRALAGRTFNWREIARLALTRLRGAESQR